VESETGKEHAAGCFLDGIIAATGCIYGMPNIQKLYCSKITFTLADLSFGRTVRRPGRAEGWI